MNCLSEVERLRQERVEIAKRLAELKAWSDGDIPYSLDTPQSAGYGTAQLEVRKIFGWVGQ